MFVTLKTGVMDAENSAFYILNKIYFKIYWNRKTLFWIEMMFHNITILTIFDQNKCNLDEDKRLSNRPQTVLYIRYSTVNFEHGSSNQILEAELSFWIVYCIIKMDFWGSIIMLINSNWLIISIPISCRVPTRFRWRGLFGGLSPHRQWLWLQWRSEPSWPGLSLLLSPGSLPSGRAHPQR